jgi:transaldolase
VKSVTEIYNYYKHFGHKTEVMGASFRNKGEIVELCGCDLLTISPALLGELAAANEAITPKLNEADAKAAKIERLDCSEKAFRWHFNEDAMAVDKTAEGIRKFAEDIVKLEKVVQAKL